MPQQPASAQSQTTVKALGLNINPNFLDLPNGTLVTANDVIIKRENVVESRRGLSDWSQGLGVSDDRVDQLMDYKARLIAHYGTSLSFDTGLQDSTGKEIFNQFAGSYSSASPYRIRSVESNKNLYFTTSNGIKKISAVTADDFSTSAGYVQDAGAVKAIDFTAALAITQGQLDGFLPVDSGVAYRTVWGYNDANTNLILGAPSNRNLVYNNLNNSYVADFNTLLGILDIFGTSTAITAISVANPTHITTATPHGLATNDYVNITGTSTSASTNGSFQATVVDATHFTIPVNVASVSTGTGTMTRSLINNANYYTDFNLTLNAIGNTIRDATVGLVEAIDADILLATGPSGSLAPLSMSTIAMDIAGDVTVSFTQDPTPYIRVDDYIQFANLTNTTTTTNLSITGISAANPTVITTSAAHGLTSGQTVTISNCTGATPEPNGVFVVTVVDATHFSVPFNVGASTGGTGTVTVTSGANLTVFNSNFQVTAVNSSAKTVTFLYPFPVGITQFAITSTPINTAGTLNSYNFTQIINSGDDSFPTSLNDTSISTPITSGEMATIVDVLNRILLQLQNLPVSILPLVFVTNYLTDYVITASGNVDLVIDIPTDSQGNQLNSEYFLQVYRSNVFQAFTGSQQDPNVLGVTVIPDDELHLVYEYFPTAQDFTNGYVSFTDSYPDSLAKSNTPLYTNPTTGDGILQSNDLPPYAQDINIFFNYVFYANTKSKHLIPNFQLLGVDNITSGDKITIGNENTSATYTFVDGVQEVTQFTITAADATALKTAVQNRYFTINSANDITKYYAWFRYDGAGTDPAPAGLTPIIIDIATGNSVATVCQRTSDTIANYIFDFTCASSATTFTVTNVDAGITTNGTIGNISGSNLAVSVTSQGNGENAATGQVLISRTISPAVNIDLTAKSLIRVINRTASSPIYAYYTSGDTTSPGQMSLESKTLADDPFYIIASATQFNTGTLGIGSSFSPNISPTHVTTGAITTSSTSGFITFNATAHGLQNGFQVIITNTNASGSGFTNVDGVYNVANVTANTFDVAHTAITGAGTHFSWELTSDSVASTNSIKPNRLFYSKFNQPDAVPLLNYFDVGREDKAILRIFPLRSSLFVFKEDGLYLVSGQTAQSFTVQLFDSSCVLTAPDTVDVTENVVFGWTTKGIVNCTESGTNIISTPIDTQLNALATYPNYSTVTWGVGYNSDNSYTVFTNAQNTDDVATIGYRYSTLTKTWTNIVRTQTCGIIKPENDLLYMGDGTQNLINQERKSFTRLDFADRDFTLIINEGGISPSGKIIQFASVTELEEGDVLVQDQYLTIYKFNNLLQNIDLDPAIVAAGSNDYYSTLVASIGDNMRTKLLALATKLDADSVTQTKTYAAHIADYTKTITINSIANPTVITTSTVHDLIPGRVITITGTQAVASIPSILGTYQVSNTGTWGSSSTLTIPINVTTGGTTGLTLSTNANSSGFLDLQACYNGVVNLLNNDNGLLNSSYALITFDTPLEAVILDVNTTTKKVTLNIGLQWVPGDIQVYKAIPCEIIYAPLTFGDVLNWKQLFQATIMFSNTAFTEATFSFSSDLKPDFISIPFKNSGNGIFGSYSDPGFGGGYFGGSGNAKPFRTLIPLQTQRCRYLNVKFQHQVAREICAVYGVTVTGNVGLSFRAFR